MENFSHVPSQPAVIPSPRSVLSCNKRLPLDTWNLSGPQENVFVDPRSTLESLQIPYRGIHPFMTPNASVEAPALISTGAQFQCQHLQAGPLTMNSFVPVDIPQSSMVGHQRQQISELQFDKFPTTSSFFVGR